MTDTFQFKTSTIRQNQPNSQTKISTIMKKNRKKYSLDELLERTPALSKNDQASSVGGYFCYTADGTFNAEFHIKL